MVSTLTVDRHNLLVTSRLLRGLNPGQVQAAPLTAKRRTGSMWVAEMGYVDHVPSLSGYQALTGGRPARHAARQFHSLSQTT